MLDFKDVRFNHEENYQQFEIISSRVGSKQLPSANEIVEDETAGQRQALISL